jgi:hypothetical protein
MKTNWINSAIEVEKEKNEPGSRVYSKIAGNLLRG